MTLKVAAEWLERIDDMTDWRGRRGVALYRIHGYSGDEAKASASDLYRLISGCCWRIRNGAACQWLWMSVKFNHFHCQIYCDVNSTATQHGSGTLSEPIIKCSTLPQIAEGDEMKIQQIYVWSLIPRFAYSNSWVSRHYFIIKEEPLTNTRSGRMIVFPVHTTS